MLFPGPSTGFTSTDPMSPSKSPPYYDSLIAKLIIYTSKREQCLAPLRLELNEYVIERVDTLIPLHLSLANNEDIIKANFYIHFLERISEKEN